MIAWRTLLVDDDLARARRIALALAAMEYPARVTNARDGSPDPGEPDDHAGGAPTCAVGPWSVEVRDLDWMDLDDVVGELVAEQDEFDDCLERRHGRALRWQRVALLFVVILVSVLATFGMIQL